MKDYKFKDNKERQRYEMDLEDGTVALIAYSETPSGAIALTHTEVPYDHENQGVGTQLVERCLEDIQAQGRKVVPACSFVAAYISRHPEWLGLVSQTY